jgi:hypothetical protein
MVLELPTLVFHPISRGTHVCSLAAYPPPTPTFPKKRRFVGKYTKIKVTESCIHDDYEYTTKVYKRISIVFGVHIQTMQQWKIVK